MATAIERKFLISEVPFEELQAASPCNILEGFIGLEDKECVQIRKVKNGYTITRIKKPAQTALKEAGPQQKITPIKRESTLTNEPISEAVFNLLWPLAEGNRLEILRFSFEYHRYHCELDIYAGDLDALMIMEVDFDSEEDAKHFSPPPFCMRDITRDPRFSPLNLVKQGKPI